jgi:hypothetical protein
VHWGARLRARALGAYRRAAAANAAAAAPLIGTPPAAATFLRAPSPKPGIFEAKIIAPPARPPPPPRVAPASRARIVEVAAAKSGAVRAAALGAASLAVALGLALVSGACGGPTPVSRLARARVYNRINQWGQALQRARAAAPAPQQSTPCAQRALPLRAPPHAPPAAASAARIASAAAAAARAPRNASCSYPSSSSHALWGYLPGGGGWGHRG